MKGGAPLIVRMTFRPIDATEFGVEVLKGDGASTRIAYSQGHLTVDRRHSGRTAFHSGFPSASTAPAALEDNELRLEIVVDVASVEVFAQDGLVCITDQVFPAGTGMSMFSYGGSTEVEFAELAPAAESRARRSD
jgi:sucrose-6-phosphate hydrolase SacC (GH32 family)